MAYRVFLILLLVGYLSGLARAEEKPLKVFVLVGQSNMQGHAHIRTLPHIAMDPKTKEIHEAMVDENGMPRIFEDIHVAYLTTSGEQWGALTTGFGASEVKMGPELTFGVYMQRELDEPILIIKAAWGGKSLNTDFRPPSAGAYQFSEQQLANLEKRGKSVSQAKEEKREATGYYYRQTVDYVKSILADIKRVYPGYDEDQGYELSGIVWFQGWNDMVDSGTYPDRGGPDGYQEYSRLMSMFIRDLRKDFESPNLPFVIGVLGVGGPVDEYGPQQQRYKVVHQNFRNAMAAPTEQAEFQGNVAAVRTEKYWDRQLVELKARQNEVKETVKKLVAERELTKEQEEALLAQKMAEALTAEERLILDTGISNLEFHYLGSSKIMAQIGKGFAEAMLGLIKK